MKKMKRKLKKQKAKNFFKENYSLCFNFLKQSKVYIILSLAIFCIFIILGFALPVFFQQEIFDFIKQISQSLEGKSTLYTISFIFFNNLRSGFFAIVLGLGFSIFPIITAVINGYLIGFVTRFAASESGSLFVLWKLLPHGIFELPAIILSMGFGIKLGKDAIKNFFNYYKNLKIIKRLSFISPPILSFIIGSLFVLYSKSSVNLISTGLFFLLFSLLYIAVLCIALAFKNKDTKSDFKEAVRFFVFIIIPLLLIAGIIEGILVSVLG